MIRELSFGELRMHLLHAFGAGTAQGALHVRVSVPFDKSRMEDALTQLIRQHPALKTIIRKTNERYYFCEAEKARSLDQYVKFEHYQTLDDATWQTRLIAENERVLDATEQLWRLTVTTYQYRPEILDLVLIMHHALLDAGASDFLLSELIQQLTSPSQDPAPPSAFFVPMEQNAVTRCGWDKFLQVQASVGKRLAETDLMEHRSPARLADRKTCVQFIHLAPHEVENLDQFCRDQDISLNSLFASALLLAIALNTPEKRRHALFSAVSMRPFCPEVPEQGLGCYLSVMPTFHDISEASSERLTTLAREHQRETQKAFLTTGRWVPETFDPTVVEAMVSGAAEASRFNNDVGFTFSDATSGDTIAGYPVLQKYVIARRNIGNVSIILHGLKLGNNVYFTLSHVEPLQDGHWALAVKATFLTLLQTNRQ